MGIKCATITPDEKRVEGMWVGGCMAVHGCACQWEISLGTTRDTLQSLPGQSM